MEGFISSTGMSKHQNTLLLQSACLTTPHHNTKGKGGLHHTCDDHAGQPLSHHHHCCPLVYSPLVATLPDSRYTTSPPPVDKTISFL